MEPLRQNPCPLNRRHVAPVETPAGVWKHLEQQQHLCDAQQEKPLAGEMQRCKLKGTVHTKMTICWLHSKSVSCSFCTVSCTARSFRFIRPQCIIRSHRYSFCVPWYVFLTLKVLVVISRFSTEITWNNLSQEFFFPRPVAVCVSIAV